MYRVRMQLGLTDAYVARLRKEPVTVAVLDSGISPHPDLSEALLSFRDFTGKMGRDKKRYFYQTPYDEYGHGTHVCGILCGSGRLSLGKYKGICPGARLVMGKVLDHKGDGSAEEMLEGMAWILEVKEKYGIRLLNISVGVSELRDADKKRRLKQMLLKLSKEGILVVCAAGNRGPSPGSISLLGELPQVISVGCHDEMHGTGAQSSCEAYSGRGMPNAVPRKPDVVAPGTGIVSCSATWHRGMGTANAYEARSGTSMAAPIVTGCLAWALRQRPELTSAELARALTGTARDLGEAWNKQGWGMVQPRLMMEKIK